jgi:hypothetical protein
MATPLGVNLHFFLYTVLNGLSHTMYALYNVVVVVVATMV